MPLYLADCNQILKIVRVAGNDKLKNHLKNLGFVTGQSVTVITHTGENIIVKVKNVSIALGHELAKRIYV